MLLQYYLVIFFNILTFVLAGNEKCGMKNVNCNKTSEYRSIDGSCNNLKNINFGTENSTYDRLLPSKYNDGEYSFARTLTNKSLPNARELSLSIYDQGFVEKTETVTLSAMSFGQMVANDLSFTLLTNKICCTDDFQNLKVENKRCINIEVPENDTYYKEIDAVCLPFERTVTNRDIGCQESQTYADQISAVNSYLDLSNIYGNTDAQLESLRSYNYGTLNVEIRNNQEWPLSDARSSCLGLLQKEKTTCYRTGDVRAVQNPQLLTSHVLWIREHNAVARELSKLNPQSNDEEIFQETRRIIIAEYQHIAFYEFLPIYIGRDGMIENKIIYESACSPYCAFSIYSNTVIDDYNEDEPPHIYNEFAHAAYRQFHSTIAGQIGLFNNMGCQYDSLLLRDHINRPVALEEADVYDSMIRGMSKQSQLPSDIYHDPEFTRHLFVSKLRYGLDGKTLDVQRGRDHGLPSYNDMRNYCGLPKVEIFTDFLDVMTQDKINKLQEFYEDPNDVDLLVGGSMETNVKGALAGPTFLCIMHKQFHRIRTADRFWFEGKDSGLTPDQLREIRKSSIAKIFCDNGNNIKEMQMWAFEQPSVRNRIYDCKDIPRLNLTLWKK